MAEIINVGAIADFGFISLFDIRIANNLNRSNNRETHTRQIFVFLMLMYLFLLGINLHVVIHFGDFDGAGWSGRVCYGLEKDRSGPIG